MTRLLFAVLALWSAATPGKHRRPAPPDAGTPAAVHPAATPDAWDFDGLRARVSAHGQTKDSLSTAALSQLGVPLDAEASLLVSAHPNTVGGVTLRVADPGNPSAFCDLFASRDGTAALKFEDSRCSFPVFTGSARTTAICRKVSGSAHKRGEVVALVASSPDCTAQPLGLPLQLMGTLKEAPAP